MVTTGHGHAPIESAYDNTGGVARSVAQGRHREVVGGDWERMGALQLDFLRAQGLRPDQRLIDVGCGSLRAGVHLVAYLEPGGYWGIDKNEALLDAGWAVELAAAGCRDRQPRAQLVALENFEFARLGETFDVGLAQSLFTHLSLNRIRLCLVRLAGAMRPGGVLFATYFEAADPRDATEPVIHSPGGVTTYPDRNPFHYFPGDFEHAIRGTPWRLERIGDWGHPRGQRMMRFSIGESVSR